MSESTTISSVKPYKIIQPKPGWISLNLAELWHFRDLLYFLAWRDVAVRYKQTVIGAAWAIIQPFFSMIVFSLFLGALAKIPSDGIPYPIFNYTAMVPWLFFSNALTQSANSLVGNANLIKKIYFPRLLIPISTVLSGVVDFALAFVVLLGMMVFYKIYPTWQIIAIFPLLLLALVTSLGVGLWLSGLNVQFRDVRYAVPFLAQFWMYGTPVVYPMSIIPEQWRWLYALNPMAGVIEGFRWALLGTNAFPSTIWVSALMALVLLVSGAYYFRRLEKTFADVV